MIYVSREEYDREIDKINQDALNAERDYELKRIVFYNRLVAYLKTYAAEQPPKKSV